MNRTDEQLAVLYAKSKEERILEELIRRYLPMVFGFVKRYTGNNDAASDITQEVFVKVWKNIDSFDNSKKFKTWIFTIAKRTAIDELRKKKAVPFSVLQEDGFDNFEELIPDNALPIGESLFLKQITLEFAKNLSKLPENYRSVIDLYINQGLNLREIATHLKSPLNTVKSRYRRGILIIKKGFSL